MTDPSGHRERRPWTEDEDRLLRLGIEREDPAANPPTKWHAIANHVPNRTNKDCRKRWWAQMATTVAKGGWSADEDERLCTAVEEYGTKWALVAKQVQTRNSGQCAKRWNDALNPAIDRSEWSEEEDFQLVEAVKVQGKSWTNIVRAHLPGRTGLAAKNRYNHLTRSSADRTAPGRERRKSSAAAPYSTHRHASAVPPSSSASTDSTPPRSSRGPSPTDSYHSSPYAGPGALGLKKEEPAYALGYAPPDGGARDRRHHTLQLSHPSDGPMGYASASGSTTNGHANGHGGGAYGQLAPQYGGYGVQHAPAPLEPPAHYGAPQQQQQQQQQQHAAYFPNAHLDARTNGYGAPAPHAHYGAAGGGVQDVGPGAYGGQPQQQAYLPPTQPYRYGGAPNGYGDGHAPSAGIKHADGYARAVLPPPSAQYEHRLPPLAQAYDGPGGQPIKQEVANGMVNQLW